MNIVIIEDEQVVANDLELSLLQLTDEHTQIVQLYSVREAIAYFSQAPSTDLIFSDIQLGDGLSFEIFLEVKITAPVIFCTAYDAYALEAFKSNGIDYILKPFTMETLATAMLRYRQLKQTFSTTQTPPYDVLMRLLAEKTSPQSASVLVYYQDKIIPVKLDEIAMMYISNEVTRILTFSGKTFYPNKNLDELEKLSGLSFFRSNRQFLVARKAITDVSSFSSRKFLLNLNISFDEKIIVSKRRVPQFLEWLATV